MRNYKSELISDLKDPEYAAMYLEAALDESVDTFLVALRDVAEATSGMKSLADAAAVNRENLYRMLSEQGNPTIKGWHSVVQALGFRIRFEPVAATASKSSPRR